MEAYDLGLLIGLSCLMLSGLILGTKSLFSPLAIFTVMSAPAFLFRPALLLSGASSPTLPWLLPADATPVVRHALWLFIVSYASYWLGYSIPGGRRWVMRVIPTFRRDEDLDRRSLTLLAIVIIGISLSVTLLFSRRAGGLDMFSFQARRGLFDGIFLLSKLPMVASVLGIVLVLEAKRSGRSLRLPATLLLLSWITIVLYDERSGFAEGLILLALGYHVAIKRVRLHTVLAVAILAVLLLSILGDVREQRRLELSGRQATRAPESLGDRITDTMNLNTVDHLLVILNDFRFESLHMGSDFVTGFVGIVPRAVWPSKPKNISPGGWFADRYTNGSGGRPFTAAGEWWLNFGMPGVAAGGLLSGFLGRGLWSYVQRDETEKIWRVLMYGVLVAFVTPAGFISVTTPVRGVIFFAPLFAVRMLARRRRRRRSPVLPMLAVSAHGSPATV